MPLEAVRHRIFIDFRVNSGPYFESFFGHRGLTFHFFVRACFQVTFCTDFWLELQTLGAPKTMLISVVCWKPWEHFF